MHHEFKILDWDSNYFGFGVASIINDKLKYELLSKILLQLKDKNIKLVYWASDKDDIESQKSAQKLRGILCDKKTTYSRSLYNFDNNRIAYNSEIVEYTSNEPTNELIQLSIVSGEYSRFKIDKNIPYEKFEGLYKLWMINSVNKKVADVVFVNYKEDKIVAMVTVQKKDGNGIIGIIAVDSRMRGKHLGEDLVNKSLLWSKHEDCISAKVVTQYDNKPACRLYEKCRYSIEKIQNFYHFWL